MSFRPSVEITLGDSTHSLKIGYGELYEFERVMNVAFLDAFGGTPAIRAVVTLLRIGLKWKFRAKEMNERKITDIFNSHPSQFIDAVGKIAELTEQLFPSAEETESDGDSPLPQETEQPLA